MFFFSFFFSPALGWFLQNKLRFLFSFSRSRLFSFLLIFFFCQQGPPYLHSRRASVRQQGLSCLHSRRALVRQEQGLPYLLSRRAFVLGEDLHTRYWERPQRVLRSGTTLVGRLLAGFPSAVLQSGGGHPVALVLCGAGSREVFGHLRLAGPTDYTRFRDGSCWLIRGYWHRVVGLWLGWVLRESRLRTDCALVCGGFGVVGVGRHGNRR